LVVQTRSLTFSFGKLVKALTQLPLVRKTDINVKLFVRVSVLQWMVFVVTHG